MRGAQVTGHEEHAEIMLLGSLSNILENYEDRKAAIEQIRLALKAYDEVKSES